MIIIKNALIVKVLKHSSQIGTKTAILTNNLTNAEMHLDDAITERQYFYLVNIPELTEGEYTLRIMLDDTTLESALLYYGEINNTKTEYITENNTYVYGE